MNAFECFDVNRPGLEVLVRLERVIPGCIAPVRWPHVLLEVRVLLALLEVYAHHPLEVEIREKTIAGHPVIHASRLIVPKVLEWNHVTVRNVERHV